MEDDSQFRRREELLNDDLMLSLLVEKRQIDEFLVLRRQLKFIREYTDIVRLNNKEKLLSFLQVPCDVPPIRVSNDDGYLNPVLFNIICKHCSVECAKALLQGETDWKVDVNAQSEFGSYPLHEAAGSFSIEMVNLLLWHNARTNLRAKGPDNPQQLRYPPSAAIHGFLPLNVAVGNLRHHKYLNCLTKKDSIFKIFILLCLPKMRPFLDFIRLLAQHTDETVDELGRYIERAEVIQMAILFMAARKQIMAPTSMNKDGVPLSGIQVSLAHASLSVMLMEGNHKNGQPVKGKNGQSVNAKNGNYVKGCKKKKKAIFSANLLLQVIEKTGDALDEFFLTENSKVSEKDVVEYITSLLAREGFELKKRDTAFGNLDRNECLEEEGTNELDMEDEKEEEEDDNDDDEEEEEDEEEKAKRKEEHEELLRTLREEGFFIQVKQQRALAQPLYAEKCTEKQKVSSDTVSWEMFTRFIPSWKGVLLSPSFVEQPIFSCDLIVASSATNLLSNYQSMRQFSTSVTNFPSNYQSWRLFSSAVSFLRKIVRRV